MKKPEFKIEIIPTAESFTNTYKIVLYTDGVVEQVYYAGNDILRAGEIAMQLEAFTKYYKY